MSDFWKKKLTAFDEDLRRMVESLTDKPCELCNGGDNYFFEVNYSEHNDPNYILAIWDAIEGRLGDRVLEMKDDAGRSSLFIRVKFTGDREAEKMHSKIVEE